MAETTLSIDDFNSVCRFCLQSKENMSPYTTQIIQMTEECTSIQEPVNLKLPNQICDNCYWQLQISYQFKLQYVLSVEMLCNVFLSKNLGNKYSEESKIIISIRDQLRKNRNCSKKATDDSTNGIDATNNECAVKTEIEINESNWKEEIPDTSVVAATNETQQAIENTPYENEKAKKEEIETLDEDESNLFQFDNFCNDSDDPDYDVEEDDGFESSLTNNKKKRKSKSKIENIAYESDDFTCNICGKKLSTRKTLLGHLKTHTTDRKFKFHCEVCNKGFYHTSNLNRHLMRHEGRANYKCDICSKRFYELSILGQHNRKAHKAKPIKCDKCSLQFYHPLHLKRHEQTHEQKNSCDICGRIFQWRYQLKNHLEKHSETRYKCKFCDKSFQERPNLTAHIRLHHKDKLPKRRYKPEVCFICGKLVTCGLSKHLETHDKGANKCEHCGKVYSRRSELARHIKQKHTDDPNRQRYSCKICDKSLLNKKTLAKHMKYQHSEVPKIRCHLCEKTYKTKKNMEMHIAAAHLDIRPYSCTLCMKAFHTKALLKKHMVTHTRERPYPCTICGKAFGFPEVLKTHMRVHNNIICK